MIKINLLGEASAHDQGGKVALTMYFGSICALLLLCYLFQSSLSSQVNELTTKTENLQNELTRVEKVTKEVKDLEAKKNEFNAKLIVIAMLKKNKMGPVRVLDDLNNALPEKAWLTEVREKDGAFTISGRALDNQTVAAFIRELEKSDYFGEQRNQTLKAWEKDGVKIKEFSFDTRIYYGGKLAAQQALTVQADGKSADAAPNKG